MLPCLLPVLGHGQQSLLASVADRQVREDNLLKLALGWRHQGGKPRRTKGLVEDGQRASEAMGQGVEGEEDLGTQEYGQGQVLTQELGRQQ